MTGWTGTRTNAPDDPYAPAALQAQWAAVLEALDPDRTGPLLARALGEDPATPCVVADAKYEPGRPATVLYRFGAGLVLATVPAPGQRAPGELLPDGTGVSRFPADPGLPTLAHVLAPGVLGAALHDELVGELDRELDGEPDGGLDDTLENAPDLRLLRYRPGRRATLLVTVPVGASGVRTYVAKVYHDSAKAAAVASEGRALQAQPLRPPLVLAPVMAHLPDLAVVVQGRLPGRELVVGLRDPDVVARQGRDVERAAKALAAFHRATVPSGRLRPLDRELHRFVARSTAIRAVDPAGGGPLLALAHELLDRQPAPGPVSLVHGDCRPSQFLLDDDRVALLDLDHCGIAEPACDVGNFVSSLLQSAVRATAAGATRDGVARDGAAAGAAEALGETFMTAYLSCARPPARGENGELGGPTDLTQRVRFHVAVSLLRKALRAWARSPVASLAEQYVAEARRAVAEPEGSFHGRR